VLPADPKRWSYDGRIPFSSRTGLSLAQQNTDPLLIKSRTALAAEYSARADKIEGSAFWKDPENE
jgi:hypothetical protein